MSENLNTPKHHPEQENNKENGKELPSAETLLKRIDAINIQNPETDIHSLVLGIQEKLKKFIQNNMDVPPALLSIVETLEKNQKPSNISVSTIARIIS